MIPLPAPATFAGPSEYWMIGVHATCAGIVMPPWNAVCVGLFADISSSQRIFWSSVDASRSNRAR